MKRIYNTFSQTLTSFHGRYLPEDANILAGYGALIHAFDLQVPLPEKLATISIKHKRIRTAPDKI